MIEQFRPYTLIAGPFTDDSASAITLVDTGGNALKCNYISVEASGTDTHDSFIVSIDAAHLNTPLGSQRTAAQAISYMASGFVGGAGRIQGGYPVELVLADNDRTSAIKIQKAKASTALFIITYGQVWTGNPIRDGDRPKGG
jgi:hypothetical protein